MTPRHERLVDTRPGLSSRTASCAAIGGAAGRGRPDAARLVPLMPGCPAEPTAGGVDGRAPDIYRPPDDQPDVGKFAALADASVTALGP